MPYRAARMLNQLRRGHRVWPMFKLKSGAAMAAPATPMPPPLMVVRAQCGMSVVPNTWSVHHHICSRTHLEGELICVEQQRKRGRGGAKLQYVSHTWGSVQQDASNMFHP